MALPNRRVIGQIDKHIQRLGGGVKLGEMEWPVNKIQFPSSGLSKGNGSNMIRVIVVPSTEKLSREWHSVKKDRGREIVFLNLLSLLLRHEPSIWNITFGKSHLHGHRKLSIRRLTK